MKLSYLVAGILGVTTAFAGYTAYQLDNANKKFENDNLALTERNSALTQ